LTVTELENEALMPTWIVFGRFKSSWFLDFRVFAFPFC